VSLRKKLILLCVLVASAVVLVLALAPGNQDRSPLARTMAEESAAWFDHEEDLSTLGGDLRAGRVAAIGVAERYALVSRTDDTRYYVNVPTGHEALATLLAAHLGSEGLKVFAIPFALTTGGPGTSTEVFSATDYLTTVQFFDFGKGSAMGILFLIMVSVIITVFFKQMRKTMG